jgi:Domain of unknown function (DUF4389)
VNARRVQYPVVVEVDYAPRQSRWKAALRLPLSLPVLLFSVLLQGGVTIAVWAAIVVSGRIPRWLFDFEVAANRWTTRAVGYFLILTDDYPPFEGQHSIRYEAQYPTQLYRWKVWIWKLITSIPHFIVLAALSLSLVIAVPVSWFAIIITGRYPVRLHGYVSGVLRWAARVHAYVLSLTDELPPFSLSAQPEDPWPHTKPIATTMGLTAVAGFIAFTAALLILRPGDIVAEVSYQQLVAGELSPGDALVQVDAGQDDFDYSQTGTVELGAATDPADALLPMFSTESGYRLVQFELAVAVQTWEFWEVTESEFRLTDNHGTHHRPLLVLVDGRPPIVELNRGDTASITVVFEIPDPATPAALRLRMDHHIHRTLTYTFN